MTKYQVAVAAEAFAAGVFAQAGCDVLVQYGANQPGYDLVVKKGGRTIPVSVKGSSDGGWLLTTKSPKGTYSDALSQWRKKNASIVFCYVQFEDVAIGSTPRMYLVRGRELAKFMKTHGYGDIALSLYEDYTPSRGPNKGVPRRVPDSWKFTTARVNQILQDS